MNERIKELALKAYNNSGQGTPEALSSFMEVYSEKFAELIIKECAEIVDNKEMITAAQTYDEVFVARYDTKEFCAKQILEHFGIEDESQ